MTTNTNNTVAVRQFVTPNTLVTMTNVKIDTAKFRFSLMVSLSSNGVIWSVPEEVTGTITKELRDWIALVKDEKLKVTADNEKGFEYVKTGRRLTAFNKYVEKVFPSIKDKTDTLQDIVFTSDNLGDTYVNNPFRLVRGLDFATLTLVNVPSKKRIEVVNEETGESTVHYSTKYGKFNDGQAVKAFIRPEKYVRYRFEQIVEREIYQD